MSQYDGASWDAFTPMLDTSANPPLGDKDLQTEGLFSIMEALLHFETLRHRPVLLYMAEDRAPFPKIIDDDDILIIYDMLRRLGPLEQLDLIVNTSGGNVTTVRKLLHLLHTMVSHLTVLVPYKARSAGTLLCLGAHDVVLTPLAELSPIDPYLDGMQRGKPTMLSAEDIATFRTMAHDWFGVQSEDDAISLLRLFCDHMFPPSLAHFFRAEQLVRQIALEAVHFQLPDASVDTHRHIVEQLLTGYHDHLYPLNQTDLTHLGLHITMSSSEEERLLWSIWAHSRTYLDRFQQSSGNAQNVYVNGLVLGSHFCARHRVQMSASLLPEQEREGVATQFFHIPRWEILQRDHNAGMG
jgi:hypothetical protein